MALLLCADLKRSTEMLCSTVGTNTWIWSLRLQRWWKHGSSIRETGGSFLCPPRVPTLSTPSCADWGNMSREHVISVVVCIVSIFNLTNYLSSALTTQRHLQQQLQQQQQACVDWYCNNCYRHHLYTMYSLSRLMPMKQRPIISLNSSKYSYSSPKLAKIWNSSAVEVCWVNKFLIF